MGAVNEDDSPIYDGIKRGFPSGAQDHVTYGRNEPVLSDFHQSIARARSALAAFTSSQENT